MFCKHARDEIKLKQVIWKKNKGSKLVNLNNIAVINSLTTSK